VKVISLEKAGLIYAMQHGIALPPDAFDTLTIEDAIEMPDATDCGTFDQYLGKCKYKGVEVYS